MVYRILREDWQILDPLPVGTTGSGVPVYDDGTTTPPWHGRPGMSKEEYIVSDALRLMTEPAEQIRQKRPQFPLELFPEQFGYDTTPLSIEQILDTNRWEPQRRSWVSGVVRYPRHSDVDNSNMSGTARNINSSLSPGG